MIDLKLEKALEDARTRGKEFLKDLFDSPDLVFGEEFCIHFYKINSINYNEYILKSQLELLENPGNFGLFLRIFHEDIGFKYPIWQFNEDGIVYPEIELLHDILKDSWTVYRFLIQSHNAANGKTGIELLHSGKTKLLLELAKGYYIDFT